MNFPLHATSINIRKKLNYDCWRMKLRWFTNSNIFLIALWYCGDRTRFNKSMIINFPF